MTSRRYNRFVDEAEAAPVEVTLHDKKLQALEKKFSLDQAIALFRKEREASSLLQNACNKAEDLLRSGKCKGLGDSLNYDSQVAIAAFTLDGSDNISEDFNNQSRSLTSSSWSSFHYKGMWLLMNKAILTHGHSVSSTLYRGIKTKINASLDKTYCFRQVSSTSRDFQVAQDFSGCQGTVYIIEALRCLSIRALSKFPNEDEYILLAFDTFTVTKVDDTGSCRMIYLEP